MARRLPLLSLPSLDGRRCGVTCAFPPLPCRPSIGLRFRVRRYLGSSLRCPSVEVTKPFLPVRESIKREATTAVDRLPMQVPRQSAPAWHSSLDAVGVEFATGMVQPCPAWWGMRINQTRKQQTVDNHPHSTSAIPFHPSGDPSSHSAFQQPGGGEGRSYSTRKKKGDQPECGVHPSLRGLSLRKDNASLSKLAGTANKRFSIRPSV